MHSHYLQFIKEHGDSGYAFELLAPKPRPYLFKGVKLSVSRYPRHHLFGVHNLEPQVYRDKRNYEYNDDSSYPDEVAIKTQIKYSFFDFYVLQYMTSMLQASKVILNHKLETTIFEAFNKVTHRFGLGLLDALDRATRREIRHLYDNFYIWDNKHPTVKLARKWMHHPAEIPWSDMITLFSLPQESDDCVTSKYDLEDDDDSDAVVTPAVWEDSYGGKLWATGVKALLDLRNILLRQDTDALVVQVDHIFDLQHNSGCLLNKTEFRCINKKYLDHRYRATHIHDLVLMCSPKVRHLFNRIAPYLSLTPITTDPVISITCNKQAYLVTHPLATRLATAKYKHVRKFEQALMQVALKSIARPYPSIPNITVHSKNINRVLLRVTELR